MHLITHNTRKYQISSKKNLKIPKGYSETVNLTDNIMAETKSQSLFDKKLHMKLRIEQHEPN